MAFKDNFRGDSAYTQIMTKIFNIFWLSILWLLCCIPVITIGASTIALYYVMLKLVKDEETTVTREFFHSFKFSSVITGNCDRSGGGCGAGRGFSYPGSSRKGTGSFFYVRLLYCSRDYLRSSLFLCISASCKV